MKNRWPTIKFGEVLELDTDRVPVDSDTTYDMVGVYSFGRGLFHREPVYGANTSYKYFYRLRSDHVVMSQLFGWEGALALSSEEFAGKFLSPQFPTFRTHSDLLDRLFLGWHIRRPTFWSDLGVRTKGMGDRRRTLSPAALFDCSIPLPPLDEQLRIVARIEKLAAKIEEARNLKSQADKEGEIFTKTILNKVYAATKGSCGLTDLEYLCVTITDGNHQTPIFVDNGIKFIFVGNVSSGYLHFNNCKYVTRDYYASIKDSRKPKRGDILYSAVGATLGIPAIVDCDEAFCFQRHVAIIKPDHDKLEPKFLWYMLRSSTIYKRAWEEKTGSAQPTVPLRAIRKFPIPVPSITEQHHVVTYLDKLLSKMDTIKRLQAETTAELDALLPSILDKAFKGEL